MKRCVLTELEDERLIWAYAEPDINKVRGKSGPEKLQVFRELSDGQRALFMFQVLYGHMEHGTNGFYDQISYLADQMDIWAALRSGMRYFEADEMYDLIGKMEKGYTCRAEGRSDKETMEELDEIYRKLIPALVRSIAERIRSHPDNFLLLED
jgi:hypothetical protein